MIQCDSGTKCFEEKYTNMTEMHGTHSLEFDLVALKKKLRDAVRALVRALSEQEREKSSGVLREKLERDDAFIRAKTVMLFWPLKDEPDLRPLIERACLQGKRVYLPKITAGTMHAYRYSDTSGLIRNDLGVMEPEDNGEGIQPQGLDCVVVPGQAFSSDGRRLGRGGGFYDRFLAQTNEAAATVGVCFSCQLFEQIPFAAHDRAVQRVFSA
jgi:5-formyltetrahydrofolate cyclo-ligase